MAFDRRALLLGGLALVVAAPSFADEPLPTFAALEAQIGGRLGVAARDMGTGRTLACRADERFPMCSTFKLIAVSAVLVRVDRGEETLGRWIAYGEKDLLDYAPITRAHVAEGGMTVGALCAAAVSWSDNTAANLLLATIGGPEGATRYARRLGDRFTRIDRTEPDANTAIPGDPRDTTTPGAMLADVKSLIFGRALSEESRARLIGWLVNYRTFFARIPAGLPPGWRSANKMGTGANGTTNDVAIVWPPGRAPILVAAYCTGSNAPQADIDAALAGVGQLVAAMH